MASNEEGFTALVTVFVVLLIGVAVFRIIGGANPDSTLLVWLTSRPNLFLGIIIVLMIMGAILSIAQGQR